MPKDRPNVVLIMTDQQRGDCLGLDPNAPEALQTPNLDWLGATGAFFSRGYSECPSCIPARRSLMTGTAPAANGVVGFQSTEWKPAHTLAGELSRAGYQTEMIGKLHLSPLRKRYGFDHMQLADGTRGEGKRLRGLAARTPRAHGGGSRYGARAFVKRLGGTAAPSARRADAYVLVRGPGDGVSSEAGSICAFLPESLLYRSASAADAATGLLRPLHQSRAAGTGCGRLGARVRRAAQGVGSECVGDLSGCRTICSVRVRRTTGW